MVHPSSLVKILGKQRLLYTRYGESLPKKMDIVETGEQGVIPLIALRGKGGNKYIQIVGGSVCGGVKVLKCLHRFENIYINYCVILEGLF